MSVCFVLICKGWLEVSFGGWYGWDVHSVPVLERPRLRICMGFCRGCRGMTGYGEGRGTSLPLILRFMMEVGLRGACCIDHN
jgi:hypothetical protein